MAVKNCAASLWWLIGEPPLGEQDQHMQECMGPFKISAVDARWLLFICLLILLLLFKNPEAETLVHLLGSYTGEVLQRCRQYRDQLLASCLTLILKLPLCIVTEIFPKLIIPLQVGCFFFHSYYGDIVFECR